MPARPVRAGFPPRPMASAMIRSSGVVTLMFDASPSTILTVWPARSARAASSVASPVTSQRVAQHVAPERLWRLGEKDGLAIQRRPDHVPGDLLDRVARAERGERRTRLGGRGNRPRDETAARKRTRGIVNDDDIRALGDEPERGRHRILAACASGHDAQRL